jgi:hypothetical protein
MKHYRAVAERHHNSEATPLCLDYTEKDGSEKEILAKAVIDTLIEDLCAELSDGEKEEITKLVVSNKKFEKVFHEEEYLDGVPFSQPGGWLVSRDRGDVVVGWSDSDNIKGVDKYEARFVSLILTKEQIESVTYIAMDEDLERLDSTDIPEVLEMGVFRYFNGDIKVEPLG